MSPPIHGPRPGWRTAAGFVLGAFVALWLALPALVASRIRAAAAGRGLAASWRSLALHPPLGVSLRGLSLTSAAGDTAVRIETLEWALDPWSLAGRARWPSRLAISGARITQHSRGDDDAEPPPLRARGLSRPDRLPRIRQAARAAARLMMTDPARLRLTLRDVTLVSARTGEAPRTALHVDSLDLGPQRPGVRLTARGVAHLEDETPFSVDVMSSRDGRLTGGLDFQIASHGPSQRLAMSFDARLERGGSPRALRLMDGSMITVGPVPLRVSGFIEPSAPRVHLAIDARDVRPDVLVRRIPQTLLGPLASVRVHGAFDYSLSLDLDLAQPDGMAFHADVTPHGLALDSAGTQLNLAGLSAPFTAQIHLPHERIVPRVLSASNGSFLPLDDIDSTLAHAVVTNEDGGFFHHRGFNTDAVRDAVAENLHAGAYRRGAGTITMQLARNLYLGHERTLARKAQEVVLAWILEHLTGVSKHRLLEIYLNIIEWGPGVQGADEATRYYFNHGAGRVTIEEALFLATLVPSPNRWKNRFDPDGALRSSERAQMHFIGRAMIAKGWLDASRLPPTDSLRVELSGRAREALMPVTTPVDTLSLEPSTENTDDPTAPN